VKAIVVVGVPIDSLGKPGGTELAPGVLREHGIAEALGARDAGDLPVRIVGEERDPASGIVGYPTVVATCEGVRDGVAPWLQSGVFTVVLGGCCSLVPGVAAALQMSGDGPVGLAYIDGHLDTYDPRTSPTGEAADMPVAICAGLGDRALVGLGPAIPLVDPAHIALLAHRDGEAALAEGSVMPDALGIATSIDCATVQRGPRQTGERIAARLAEGAGRFWVSIDVDVLTSTAMPATPVQQAGGLSLEELAELAEPLVRHPACVGLDLLCYDVDMDDAAHTSGAHLVGLLTRVLDGESAAGAAP
jgi:arginase